MRIKLPIWSNWLDNKIRQGVMSQAEAIEAAAIIKATPEIYERAKIEVVQEVARSLVAPGKDVVPTSYPGVGKSPYPLYGYDRPLVYGTPLSPNRRPESAVTIETIERFARSYDILRSCINHLKREVQSQPFNITARDLSDKSAATKARVRAAKDFFTKRGGLGELNETRRHYEAKIFEDVLVVGAFAVYKDRAKSGKLLKALPIAAKTIRPRMDAYGWPGPDEAWYEQWIMGMIVADFAPDELTYDGLWPETNSPWFISPVEWLISTTLSALKSDEWNRVWLTDGNTPGNAITTPESWTPSQIIEYANYFNEMLAGKSQNRNTSVFLPGGMKSSDTHSRKDQDFKEFDLWLARRTGAIYGVHLAAIGFAGEQYKVTQDGSMDATTQFGASALLDIRKEHYDDLLQDLGYEDLEVTNVAAAAESPLERNQRLSSQSGWTKINELRAASELDPIEDGDVILVSNTLATLETIVKPPEPAPVATTDSEVLPDDEDEEKGVQRARKGTSEMRGDLLRWKNKALKRARSAKRPACDFTSAAIPTEVHTRIHEGLSKCEDAASVKALFRAEDPYEADENDDDDDEDETKRRLIAALLFQMKRGADAVDEAALKLLGGSIELHEFMQLAMATLGDAHIKAAWLGRLRAGGTGIINDADRALGLAEADTQRAFLSGFANDVIGGEQSEAQIASRATEYGQRLVGTANKSWLKGLPDDAEIRWIDVKDDSECEDCIRNADNGPYTAETLPSFPGDGSTECLTRCRCYLETSDGQTSFYDPEDGPMDARSKP